MAAEGEATGDTSGGDSRPVVCPNGPILHRASTRRVVLLTLGVTLGVQVFIAVGVVLFCKLILGFGTLSHVDGWYADGTRRVLGQRGTEGASGEWVYWRQDGQLNLERSGYSAYGIHMGGIGPGAQEDLSTGRTRAYRDLRHLAEMVQRFHALEHRFPSSLAECYGDPRLEELRLGAEVPILDAWGREYVYGVGAEPDTRTIGTLGSDAAPGGTEDARDWIAEFGPRLWLGIAGQR